MLRAYRAILLSVILLPCAGLVQAQEVADLVRVEDPYVRAVPPGQSNSIAFMTLYNSDDQDHALVAVASPAAKFVELHTHNLIDDMMQMRRVAQLELPAGIRVNLKPGGLHLMLIGLQQPLVAGEAVPLRLTFEDNSKLELSLPVRGLPRPRQQEVPGHTHQDQVKHPEEEHRP